jgi:phage baseplate assembly protein W
MSEKSLALPFSIDSYGKVGTTTEQSKIWADRVRSVIGTSIRERVMRPSFGTLIPYALFENETSAESQIKSEIESAFNGQLPLLTLSTTNVTFDTYTNIFNVEIIYALPNNETVSTLIGLVLIDGTKPIYQELL